MEREIEWDKKGRVCDRDIGFLPIPMFGFS
jgi:hypothetical protein